MTTGQSIREARKMAGMTQMELAHRLDIPFQSISQWERDIRKPKFETIQRIANALEISVYELMGLSDVEAWYAELNTGIDLTLIAGRIHQKFDIPMDMAEKIAEEVSNLIPVNARGGDEAVFQQLLNRLTDEGQQKGKEYLDDLSGNPRYKRAASYTPPKISTTPSDE